LNYLLNQEENFIKLLIQHSLQGFR